MLASSMVSYTRGTLIFMSVRTPRVFLMPIVSER